jgi:chromosome partitioning protein
MNHSGSSLQQYTGIEDYHQNHTHIVAFTNQKGGCGKTTTTVSLAAGIARAGRPVAVVDIDPQCNATDSFGLNREELLTQGRFTVADAYLAQRALSDILVGFGERFGGNLYVAPGHRGLSAVPQRLESELQLAVAKEEAGELEADELRNGHRRRLKAAIESVAGKVDFVLIDTPPDLGFLMTTALIAADHFVIPVFPSGYDLKGLETLMKTADRVRSRLNPALRRLGVILGNMDSTARLDADIQQMLRAKFGEEQVFQTAISRSVKHREAPVYGRTIFEHAPGQTPSNQFAELAAEFVGRLSAAQPASRGQHA